MCCSDRILVCDQACWQEDARAFFKAMTVTTVSPATTQPADSPEGALTTNALMAADEAAYARSLAAITSRLQKVELLETDVARLLQTLARFEHVCHMRVGDLVSELRRVTSAVIEAQERVGQLLAAFDPLEETTIDDVLEELDVERDLADAWGWPGPPLHGDAPPEDLSDPVGEERWDQPTLKKLYRELAKRCHPDLAGSADDRHRRAALMCDINAAYANGDGRTLRALLDKTEQEASDFAERPIAERLAWASAEVARLDQEIARLRANLVALHLSDLYRLWRRHEAGELVFHELEDDLEGRLQEEGQRLDRLNATHRRLVTASDRAGAA